MLLHATRVVYRVNPVNPGGTRNEDVTSFRHVLVEFDRDDKGQTIPKEDQYGAIIASGLPVSAVIDSANKSLHAWVRIDAPDAAEYRRRVDIVWDWFGGLFRPPEQERLAPLALP